LAAQLQQHLALGVAQLLAAHQVGGASLVAGDAVAGEHLAHQTLDAFGVLLELGHVFAQDPAGYVLRGGGAGCCLAGSVAEEFQEHQRLVDVAHGHALGDGVAQALVGGESVGGMGGSWRCGGQCWGGGVRGVALAEEKP